jgi:uncharacterized protein YfaP (DUF2135 family)
MNRKIRVVLACIGLAVAASLCAAAPVSAAADPGVPAATSPAAAHAGKARPVVTGLSAAAAKPGAALTISGRGFGAKRGKGSVLFGSFRAVEYLRWSATKIVCKVPLIPAGKLQMKVRAAGAVSKGAHFKVKAVRTVVPKTTSVLNSTTVAGASTSDGVTYSFSNTGQTSSLDAGDVIMGRPTAALPEGIFAKVSSVSDGGASVTTTPATLDEVFTSAQFSADHPITQGDFTGSANVAPGVRLMRSRVVRPSTRLLTFRLADVSVSKSAGLSTDFGPVNVSGTITLKITVHVSGAVGWGGVKSFAAGETSTVSSDLKASVTKDLSFSEERTLASWGAGQLSGFTVMVGPVPLYFQPELSIFAGVNGQFEAGVETAVHYEASGSLGLSYQPPNFSTWAGFQTKKSFTPPTLYASGSVKAYGGAQLGLKLYDLAGPYMRMDGYAQLAADTRETPWWTLKAGIEGSVGAQIGVNWGFIHWNKDWKSGNLKLAEWTLAHAATPAPALGSIAGQVQDTNGDPLAGVDVSVVSGATTVAASTSSSDGTFAIDVPAGSGYTVGFSKDGFAADSRGGVDVYEGETTTLDPVALAALPSGTEVRIVLTWGQDPSDLDSHLVGPDGAGSLFHVFYQQLGDSSYAELDHDCTTSYGPETTTIYSEIGGVYSFAVHDYTDRYSTDSTSLSLSGAVVRVYRGSVLAATFPVPSGVPGTLWTVFTMSGGVVTPVNSMSYESDPAAVLVPASFALQTQGSDSK